MDRFHGPPHLQPRRLENFFFAIRRADGMVLFIENFKSLLHSQVQQAAQESGLVSASAVIEPAHCRVPHNTLHT